MTIAIQESKSRIKEIDSTVVKAAMPRVWSNLSPQKTDSVEFADDVRREITANTRLKSALTQQRVLRRHDAVTACQNSNRTSTENFYRQWHISTCDLSESQTSGLPNDVLRDFVAATLGNIPNIVFGQVPGVKTLSLLDQPPSVIRAQLQQNVDARNALFADEFIQTMVVCKRKKIFNVIREGTKGNAEFMFFHTKVIDNPEVRRSKKKKKEFQSQRKSDHTLYSNTLAEERFASGVLQIQHVWTCHLLSKYRRVPLAYWRLPLPKRILDLVNAIPEFLLPYVSIAEGTLEAGRIIAHDCAKVPYRYERHIERREETRHYDPAVLIGDTVIAGWCPDEQPRSGLLTSARAALSHSLHKQRK